MWGSGVLKNPKFQEVLNQVRKQARAECEARFLYDMWNCSLRFDHTHLLTSGECTNQENARHILKKSFFGDLPALIKDSVKMKNGTVLVSIQCLFVCSSIVAS